MRPLKSAKKNRCATLLLAAILLSARIPLASAAGDPIAHWRFDDGAGTAPVDSGPNNITGTFMTPNPTWTTTVPPVSFTDPYSLNFGSTGDSVRFTWPSGLNFSSNAPRSFSFWYKPTGDGETASGNFDRIMSWDGDAFEIAGTFGDVSVHRLAFYDGSWRDTGFDMSVGTWYNIAFTYDGSNVHLYVSGVEKYSGASGGRALSGHMFIGGRYTGDEGINGLIDDLRIYDYPLTSTQVDNIVAGSDNADATPDASGDASSADGGGANMPVWLLNLRRQNNLSPLGTYAVSSASSSSSSSSASFSSSSSSSSSSAFTPPLQSSSAASHLAAKESPMQIRTCSRVMKWFVGNESLIARLNKRLAKWFGFECT